MQKIGAIILAAGKGTRMGSDTPKQFIEINGKPLFMYSVEKFLPLVQQVIVVTNETGISEVERILEGFGLKGQVQVFLGGKNRYDSAYAGICALEGIGEFDGVLIHDAARACIDTETIQRVIEDTKVYGAAIPCVPSVDTMKLADENGFVEKTIDRSRLFSVQTPQGFRFDLIKGAHEYLQEHPEYGALVTDDACLVEMFTKEKVRITAGSQSNIKVTHPGDLELTKKNL